MEKLQENANIKLFALNSNQALAKKSQLNWELSCVMLQSSILAMARSKSISTKVFVEMMFLLFNRSRIQLMRTLWN